MLHAWYNYRSWLLVELSIIHNVSGSHNYLKSAHRMYPIIYFMLVLFRIALLWVWYYPDSKVLIANMGPIWGRQDPGGPHVGPINFAIWEFFVNSCVPFSRILQVYCIEIRVISPIPMTQPWSILLNGIHEFTSTSIITPNNLQGNAWRRLNKTISKHHKAQIKLTHVSKEALVITKGLYFRLTLCSSMSNPGNEWVGFVIQYIY